MNREQLSELWDEWVSTELTLAKKGQDELTFGRKEKYTPKNFLGSIDWHKNSFLNFIDKKSTNNFPSSENNPIINDREQYFLGNVFCDCKDGCPLCNGTGKVIVYIPKNRKEN